MRVFLYGVCQSRTLFADLQAATPTCRLTVSMVDRRPLVGQGVRGCRFRVLRWDPCPGSKVGPGDSDDDIPQLNNHRGARTVFSRAGVPILADERSRCAIGRPMPTVCILALLIVRCHQVHSAQSAGCRLQTWTRMHQPNQCAAVLLGAWWWLPASVVRWQLETRIKVQPSCATQQIRTIII